MKLTRLLTGLLLLSGAGFGTGALAQQCPGVLTLPANTAQNSVTFGDGISYSLPILGLSVQSSPGQIQDCIVVATGSSGGPVTTNFAGMDNAYATPSGVSGSTWFKTGDVLNGQADPGGAGQFTGDLATTWDTRLTALSTFLQGSSMVVYFNHNQTNSGGAVDQDLFAWAQLRLVDDQDPARTLYFYIAATPSFIPNFGTPGGDPLAYTGPQTLPTSDYPLTGAADGTCVGTTGTFPRGGEGFGTGSGDACFMVRALGQICLNGPVGVGVPIPCTIGGNPNPAVVATVNDNLGANEVANAIVFPEINAILALPGFSGYDVLQMDIRMGCNPNTITGTPLRPSATCVPGSSLNNGFEQIFIGRLAPTEGPPTVPEPAILALFGLGLFAVGVARIRRRKI